MDPAPTILVVDDVPLFRELEALFLARCGHVVTACSAREALECAEREHPAVIVVDFHLPDLPGDELCRRLKQAGGPHAPVVVITGSGSAEEHAAAIRAGADDVLAKPLARTTLVETVQRFTRFPEPRGLPRVSLDTPVRLRARAAEAWGTVRNLSRGGIYVESHADFAIEDELALEFRLPGRDEPLEPTARVIWRDARGRPPVGLGLRFLDLDAPAARWLDEYVREWAHPDALAFAMPRASGGIR